MGNAAAFNNGARWYDDAQDAKRQAAQDAWTAEQNGRTRLGWEQADKQRADVDAAFAQVPQAGSGEFDAAQHFGLKRPPADTPAPRMATPVPQDAGHRYGRAAPELSDASQGGAPLPQGGMAPPQGATPRPAQSAQPNYAAQQRQVLEQQLAFAKAQRDPKAFQAAQQEMFKLRVGEDSAKIADYVVNADPDAYQQLLGKVTADTQNKYEAVYNAKTGLTTLKLGTAKKEFSRAEMGQYFAAKNRLKNGDYSAMADLERLDGALAASVAAELKTMDSVANRNNDAAAKGNAMRNDDARTGIANAGLQLRRAEGQRAETRATREDWAPIGVSQDGKSLTVYNKYTHETKAQPLPPGTDATDLFRRITGAAGPGKGMAPMSKVEEAGTPYRDNQTGALKYTDGRGGFVAEGGVMPQDRSLALKKSKVPDNLIARLPWNADGTAVGYAGKAYRVGDPADMRELARDYERLGASSIEVDEAQKVDNHYMNDPAKTFGRSGSIYDTPAQRTAHTRAYDAR